MHIFKGMRRYHISGTYDTYPEASVLLELRRDPARRRETTVRDFDNNEVKCPQGMMSGPAQEILIQYRIDTFMRRGRTLANADQSAKALATGGQCEQEVACRVLQRQGGLREICIAGTGRSRKQGFILNKCLFQTKGLFRFRFASRKSRVPDF